MSFLRRVCLKSTQGTILVMMLVFVAMFVVIFGALSGLTSRQYHETVLQSQDERAFQVAEAGLNYARWRLAHDPDNFTAEERTIEDQFAGELGTFTVTFEPPQEGGTVVVITSMGATANQPEREVTLRARYGIPSLSRFAFITNDDVWYGGEISGYVHSNGGIRMDGTSDSLMTSAKETYICKPIHACNNEEKPGVWGSGEKQELWEFPVAPVDYNSLTLDLLDMRTAAVELGTYYDASGAFGYHIVFNTDNTYSIYRVTQKGNIIPSWFPEDGCCYTWGSHDIGNESLIETRPVPSGGIIYTEDYAWVNGQIRDRITVAAGAFADEEGEVVTDVDIILNGDITYDGVTDGSRVFGAVAQRHVLIPWSGAENNLELNGAFVAQKGRYGRRHYPNCCGAQPHRLKNSLELFGMVASNMVPATTWVNGGGQVISGYRSGESSYDPNLLYSPPPHFPTSGTYQFISWEKVE